MAIRYETPRLPRAGSAVTANWGDQMVRSVGSHAPVQTPGMMLRRSMYGTAFTPIVSGSVAQTFATKELKPFAVRWMSHDKDGDNPSLGEWQIYVPFGAMTVRCGRTYSALPTNGAAKDADSKDIFQWFKIDAPSDGDGDIQEIDGIIHKTWTVYVLTKPWARFKADTDAEGNGKVAWTDAVATIGVAEYTQDGRTQVMHSVVQLKSGAMEKTWDTSGSFAIEYELDDETEAESSYTAKLVHQTKMLGRLQANNIEPMDVTHADGLWVVINHESEEFELEVKDSVGDGARSDDDHTIYKIYDMEDGVVTFDYRSTIPTLPFYTNAPSGGAS